MSRAIWQAILWSVLFVTSTLTVFAVNAGEPAGIGNKQMTLPATSGQNRSTTQELPGDSLDDVFTRASYNDTGRFYEIMDISGQANQIFGWRTFPGSFYDNQIANDGLTMETVYQDALRQQMSGPRFVTRDLFNPFDTSLQENPEYLRTEGQPGTNPGNTVPWQQPPMFP